MWYLYRLPRGQRWKQDRVAECDITWGGGKKEIKWRRMSVRINRKTIWVIEVAYITSKLSVLYNHRLCYVVTDYYVNERPLNYNMCCILRCEGAVSIWALNLKSKAVSSFKPWSIMCNYPWGSYESKPTPATYLLIGNLSVIQYYVRKILTI